MEIQDLKSYNLFQEINDTFLLISGFIKTTELGLDIKDIFSISTKDEIIMHDGKSDDDIKLFVDWLKDKLLELKKISKDCITLTEENFTKFKAENPAIKEEVKLRTKSLKKVLRFLDEIQLDPNTYEALKMLKSGPEIDSDYAGISVKETKYYLI